MSRKKFPTVIGSKSFVDKTKEKFFTDKKHEEVPDSRYLAPDKDRIIEEVCKFYNVNRDVLFSSRRGFFNEPRNVAIYFIRRLRGDTLKDVGKIFGIDKNSTVSSVVERLKLEIERDKNLNKRIGKLRNKLTKSQE